MNRKLSKPRSRKKRAPTVAKLKKTAWALLSRIVRYQALRPLGSDLIQCYTCGSWARASDLQAGHAIPGRTGSVLFDEEIIRPQCYRCNVALRGNYPVFTTKLIKENGMEWWERKLLLTHCVRKWTRSDLEEKIKAYRERLASSAKP
jgi:Bacteriophage Lambda NinG protein